MGKAEGGKELWQGHVTAVTVAPEYRRLGVAKQLMDSLEGVRRAIDCACGDVPCRERKCGTWGATSPDQVVIAWFAWEVLRWLPTSNFHRWADRFFSIHTVLVQ